MGQAWLRVSMELVVEMCKAYGVQTFEVVKNQLPDDAKLVRTEEHHHDTSGHDEVWLLIESAEIPESEDPGEWPAVTFQRVDIDTGWESRVCAPVRAYPMAPEEARAMLEVAGKLVAEGVRMEDLISDLGKQAPKQRDE